MDQRQEAIWHRTNPVRSAVGGASDDDWLPPAVPWYVRRRIIAHVLRDPRGVVVNVNNANHTNGVWTTSTPLHPVPSMQQQQQQQQRTGSSPMTPATPMIGTPMIGTPMIGTSTPGTPTMGTPWAIKPPLAAGLDVIRPLTLLEPGAGALEASRAMRNDFLTYVFTQYQFLVVLSVFTEPNFSATFLRWLLPYLQFVQHLVVELDLVRWGAVGYMCAPVGIRRRLTLAANELRTVEFLFAQVVTELVKRRDHGLVLNEFTLRVRSERVRGVQSPMTFPTVAQITQVNDPTAIWLHQEIHRLRKLVVRVQIMNFPLVMETMMINTLTDYIRRPIVVEELAKLKEQGAAPPQPTTPDSPDALPVFPTRDDDFIKTPVPDPTRKRGRWRRRSKKTNSTGETPEARPAPPNTPVPLPPRCVSNPPSTGLRRGPDTMNFLNEQDPAYTIVMDRFRRASTATPQQTPCKMKSSAKEEAASGSGGKSLDAKRRGS